MKPEMQKFVFEEMLRHIEESIGFQEGDEVKVSEPSSVDFSKIPYAHLNCSVLSMHISIIRTAEAPELSEIRRCGGVLQSFVSETMNLLSTASNCLDIQVVEWPFEKEGTRGRKVKIEAVFETMFRNQLDNIFSSIEKINSMGEILKWKSKLKAHTLAWAQAIDYGNVLAMRTSEKSINDRLVWCGAAKKGVENLFLEVANTQGVTFISDRIQINLTPEYVDSFIKVKEADDGNSIYAAKLINSPMMEWLTKNKG